MMYNKTTMVNTSLTSKIYNKKSGRSKKDDIPFFTHNNKKEVIRKCLKEKTISV